MASNSPTFRITPARTADHIEAAKVLFKSYAEWLGIDLTFQGFASELQSLPGQYAAPQGELLLAYSAEDVPIGCVAVRPLKKSSSAERQDLSDDGKHCEMKRLELRLDTLPWMAGAIQLYKRVGFVEIAPYYETPLEGTLFLGLDLARSTDPT
ncbi:hypothetical protein ETB97_001165 [Aspergillus alliaceus]|uniref:N-acetyltransferase domain-containing protein n=1 Tax=Petromyces alliaceus TaxID=209559 RepID=A0A8H6EB03_PETAA|nr:hypothetical protein ETB97_001165 [Aspergillus burnettii]